MQYKITWLARPPAENVLDYEVSINGVVIGITANTEFPYTLPSEGTYLASVRARNSFGFGEPGNAVLVAQKPGQVLDVKFVSL